MAELLMITLKDYIALEVKKPFVLGKADCVHFVNGWIKNVTGRDALLIFDGLPEQTARKLLRERKYLTSILRGVKSIGLKRTNSPRHGDIAVLRLKTQYVIAVRGKYGWVFKTEKGINMLKNAALFMCWGVKKCHNF